MFRRKPALAFLIWSMVASSAFAQHAGGVVATAIVDGFVVNILPLPHRDLLPMPNPVVGSVLRLTGSNGPGFDPFYRIRKLRNVSPYLSIQAGSSATFVLGKRAKAFTFFWGTPDNNQSISLYGPHDRLIGTIQGADFQTAFQFSEGVRPFPIGQEDTTQIVSPTPIARAILTEESSGICCFEFSNVRAK